jgi:hypothetical protein
MTAPSTVEVAEGVRRKMAAKPERLAEAQPIAWALLEQLAERIPGADPALVAAVLLHAGSYAGYRVWDQMNHDGILADTYHLRTANALVVAGEQLLAQQNEQPAAEQDGDAIAAELVSTKDALNAAYRERAHLLALIAAQYPSHIGHTDPAAPDWAVVTIELPTGQACWHISAADEELFAHVQPTPYYARGWDGHSTEEKYRRVRRLVAELHPEAGPDLAARDGDVRAVERARDLIEALWNGDAVTAEAGHVLAELDHRFGPRIAALDARDGSAS